MMKLMGSRCETRADRKMQGYDMAAAILLCVSVVLGWLEPSARASAGGRGDLAMAIVIACAMIGTFAAAMRRHRPEGDEYLRRMAGIAATIGVCVTFAAYHVWITLAPGIVPAPSGDRIMALMTASTCVGWFVAKSLHVG